MTGWKNWFQKLLNDQMDKLFNSLKVQNQTNQIQTQIMTERGNPLSGATQESREVEEKRPFLRRSKHVIFMKKHLNMIERWHPLFAVTHVTRKMQEKRPVLRRSKHLLFLKKLLNMIERGLPLFAVTRARSRANNAERGWHWLPNTWIATFCCETSWEIFRVRELVKKIENHPYRHALQRNLQQNKAYNPFSATTKKMIQDVSYHTGAKASSVAHAGISWKKLWTTEASLNIQWTFFQFQSTQWGRDDLMATDMGKLQKSKNIIWSIIWKRDASRGSSQGFTIVSCEILIFVNVCSNMIEMKTFVSNGTILQNKISPIECQHQNIFDTNKIGGSLSRSLETKDHWEKTFWLQPSVVYIRPFTPRIWRTTTQTATLLEAPGTAIVEFFLHLVAMEWILVVFIRIQRKSMKEDTCKDLW